MALRGSERPTDVVRLARSFLGIPQAALADRMGLHRSLLSSAESGQVELSEADCARALCLLCDIYTETKTGEGCVAVG